ncbi:hypothetical protein [Alkalibacillus salilacus]|uniref:Cellulose biosynthesis protein BcsQ n=1 Tax=Alkalibacillus salilacus TaxID=284582 RepID=A0ABT9VDL4_9BACI|nr:hypothetical protein [Alkalibacillus salilacus]MDQ0159002.1 cellulose biosynthesis protein BcsQ [Alkalibacillus salilacus]
MKDSEFLIEGMEETTEKVNELLDKMREAKTIADEIASTQIVLNDKRQKDVMEYVAELRKDFVNQKGHEPYGYHLVAEADSFQVRISLNL